MIFLLPFTALAAEGNPNANVKVTATVPEGQGTGGDGDVTIGGVHVRVAYLTDAGKAEVKDDPQGTDWGSYTENGIDLDFTASGGVIRFAFGPEFSKLTLPEGIPGSLTIDGKTLEIPSGGTLNLPR